MRRYNAQLGSSATEFILVLPLLGALLYAAQLIHDVIEHRHVTRIASRNAVHLPEGAASPFGDLVSRASPIDASVWSTSGQNSVGLSEQDRQRVEVSFAPESEVYGEGSRLLGAAADKASRFLDGMQNLNVSDHYVLIPSFVNKTSNSVATGRAHPLAKSFFFLSDDPSSPWSLKIRDQHFHRSEAGFHPNPYQYQAIFGVLMGNLGDRGHWHKLGDEEKFRFDYRQSMFSSEVGEKYNPGCLMNFVANSKCGYEPQNMLATTVRTIGIVKGVLQFIGNIFTGGGAEGINVAADEAYGEIMNIAVDSVMNKAEEELINRGQEEIEREVTGHFDDFKDKIQGELTDQAFQAVVEDVNNKLEQGSE